MNRLTFSAVALVCAVILAGGLYSGLSSRKTPPRTAPVESARPEKEPPASEASRPIAGLSPPPGKASRPVPLPVQPAEVPPTPPDEPSTADGGLAPYNYNIDQAIQFFQDKVA